MFSNIFEKVTTALGQMCFWGYAAGDAVEGIVVETLLERVALLMGL